MLAEAGATTEIVERLFAEAQRKRPNDLMMQAYAFILEGALETLRLHANGENFYGRRALYTALQMKACDYAMPDFMHIGVTGWQRAAAIAAAAGIPISTHLYPEVAAHVMRVTETAHWLECKIGRTPS